MHSNSLNHWRFGLGAGSDLLSGGFRRASARSAGQALRVVVLVLVAAAMCVSHPLTAEAQNAPRPRVFLSCAVDCFDSFLRQELNYFDFTNDPYRATHVLVVSRQPSGNGGEQLTLALGSNEVPGRGAVLPVSFIVGRGAQPEEVRRKLLQAVLVVLFDSLRQTEHAQAFQLQLPPREIAELSSLHDPWNYWVFMPELRAAGEGGSGYYYVEGNAAFTIRRVVAASKFRLRASYFRNWNGFRSEGEPLIHGSVGGYDLRALYAQSVGEHWGIGATFNTRSSEFENLEHHAHGGLLGEANLFPYQENASKQLRLAYQAGLWSSKYLEPNNEARTRELKAYHALSLIVDANQPWGSVQWVGQINHFLDTPKLFRLSGGALVGIRLFEGLALALEGEAAWVKDQINLRGRTITDRELLVWTAEQATDFTFEATFGLVYTFGSAHNTIVNPRFARVDLDEE